MREIVTIRSLEVSCCDCERPKGTKQSQNHDCFVAAAPRPVRNFVSNGARNDRAIPKAKLLKQIRFVLLVAGFWFLVVLARADSLSRAESLYLAGSYSESIEECAVNIARNKMQDKAYYLLGLNYLKIGDTEKAREKLKILIDSFAVSQYREPAKLAYADTYFMEQDYAKARVTYEDMAKNNNRLAAVAYFRLRQCALKTGDWQAVKSYSESLQQRYPLSLEAALSAEMLKENEFFFTVQVGSFANIQNATRLLNKLKSKNFDCFIDELNSLGNPLYRVRAGKLKSRQEAENLKHILEENGYSARIFP